MCLKPFNSHTLKLIYIGWINNKVLLYSTGNYIQYPVINDNGKEYEKEYLYMHKQITLLYTRNQHTTVNQLYSNTIYLRKKRVIGAHLGGCLPQAKLTLPFGCFLYFVIIILFFPG